MGNTLRDIKRRIRSVKSTQQITRAMKMVAASKFRRAEAKVSHAQRFAASIEAVMIKLAPVLRRVEHPYLSAGAPGGKGAHRTDDERQGALREFQQQPDQTD